MNLPESLLIMAVDPGKTGAIATAKFNPSDGSLNNIVVYNMPDMISEIALKTSVQKENIVVFIEKITTFGIDIENKGKLFRLQKLHENYTRIETLFHIRGINVFPVMPIHWQRSLKLKADGPEYKDRKKKWAEFSRSTFPHHKITNQKADAMCILEYARRKCVYDLNKYFPNI